MTPRPHAVGTGSETIISSHVLCGKLHTLVVSMPSPDGGLSGRLTDSFAQLKVDTGFEARVSEYWDWIAVALFLLTTVDLITTFYAASLLGPQAESNPLVRLLLMQGIETVVFANLVAVVLVAAFFYALVDLLKRTPQPYRGYFSAGIEAWLGGLLAAGLLVFANNLSVIFHGQSLL